MSKRILAAMLSCMLVVGMTGCGFSDGVKDGMKDAQKQESINDSDKNDTESRENVLESEESETGNPLLDAEVIVCDVMNGTKTEKLGEYAYITVPLETMKKVTMEQYDEFCDQKVQDSGYNWVTIDFGNGSGLQFQGSTPADILFTVVPRSWKDTGSESSLILERETVFACPKEALISLVRTG